MKASKFSDAQKAFILKQGADGTPVSEICRKLGSARRPISTGNVTAQVVWIGSRKPQRFGQVRWVAG